MATYTGGQEAPDTVFIAKDGEAPSNADIALRLSQATPMAAASRIIVARDDEFADALASGVLQGDAPLMLVSRDGVQQQVLDHMATLGTTQVVLLGGQAALPTAIAEEFTAAGYVVQRRQGATRIETAIDIAAQDSPAATDAIMVRAFASPGATDPTQAFADSLAAGGMAAEFGTPILLTQTEVLTASTRTYLEGSSIERIRVVGGTAAVSEQVVADLRGIGMTVERISGASRAATAVEIAKTRGADSAADVARVTLVQGQTADAWAGGFAAAAHSAAFDAPIVLGSQTLPSETGAFLAGGSSFAGAPEDPQGIRITCVIGADVCRQARDALGLPPIPAGPTTGGVLLSPACLVSDFAIDDAATTVLFAASQGCSEIGQPDPGFGVIDVASGAVRYVNTDPRLISISDDGGVAVVGSSDAGDTGYDLTQDPPAEIRVFGGLFSTIGDHSLSGDGTTVGVSGSASGHDGDFLDLATGTSSGPDTCSELATAGNLCNLGRPISDDGRYVYNEVLSGAGRPLLVQFGRRDIAGESQIVDAPAPSDCSQTWPVGTSGDTSVAVCDDNLSVVDYVAGMVNIIPLPAEERFREVTGVSDDGTLASVRPATLVNLTTGATSEVVDAVRIAISADGLWIVGVIGEEIVLLPTADLRP